MLFGDAKQRVEDILRAFQLKASCCFRPAWSQTSKQINAQLQQRHHEGLLR